MLNTTPLSVVNSFKTKKQLCDLAYLRNNGFDCELYGMGYTYGYRGRLLDIISLTEWYLEVNGNNNSGILLQSANMNYTSIPDFTGSITVI